MQIAESMKIWFPYCFKLLDYIIFYLGVTPPQNWGAVATVQAVGPAPPRWAGLDPSAGRRMALPIADANVSMLNRTFTSSVQDSFAIHRTSFPYPHYAELRCSLHSSVQGHCISTRKTYLYSSYVIRINNPFK